MFLLVIVLVLEFEETALLARGLRVIVALEEANVRLLEITCIVVIFISIVYI